VRDIDRRLHLSRAANAFPMAGIMRSCRVRELRIALLACGVRDIHVVLAPVLVLPRLHFLGRLRYLANRWWSRLDEGGKIQPADRKD
jgi:hypothetical protein